MKRTTILSSESLSSEAISQFKTCFTARGENECWMWSGVKHERGYGHFYLSQFGTVNAHRIAYVLATGETISTSDFICHECDNPQCVNPNHLFKGTGKTNARDRDNKGRHRVAKGDSHCFAKLTRAVIIEARQSGIAGAKLAGRYGVSRRTMERAIRGDTWRHVK